MREGQRPGGCNAAGNGSSGSRRDGRSGIAHAGDAEIGVLALQGDFQAHGKILEHLGCAWRDVRRAPDLVGLRGLVLPGGESTTMWHFLRESGLDAALQQFATQGGAMYGTCAGAILLAANVTNPPGLGLGILDIDVERNGYGRQTESSVRQARLEDAGDGDAIEAVLIRAPRIRRLGPTISVRAWIGEEPVWVERERISVTTFHPELADVTLCHAHFLAQASSAPRFATPEARTTVVR